MDSRETLPEEVAGNGRPPRSVSQPEESLTKAVDYYSRLEILLTKLENRDLNRSYYGSPASTRPNSRIDAPAASASEEATGITASGEQTAPLLPKVRECDWEQFINRFSLDDRTCIIDVLVAGYQVEKDIMLETNRRQRGAPQRPTAMIIPRIETHSRWIQLVRVQSKALLGIFTRVTGYAWGTNPHTFVQPFQYLIHFHQKFKDELSRLETLPECTLVQESWNANGALELQNNNDENLRRPQPEAPADATAEASNQAILDELRCYIKFVEEKLLPRYKHIRDGNDSTALKIRFVDLSYVFQAGDLIYMPPKCLSEHVSRMVSSQRIVTSGDRTHKTWMQQKIWRIYNVQASVDIPWESANNPNGTHNDSLGFFHVFCYYLDFDGVSYGAVSWTFTIEPFKGEKTIQELDFYPLRFVHNANDIMERHINRGHQLNSWISQKHAFFNDWSLVTDPAGFPVKAPGISAGNVTVQERPQHIEGEVVIDFREAFNYRLDYKPRFVDFKPRNLQSRMMAVDSPHAIIEWTDTNRSTKLAQSRESFIMDHTCGELETQVLLDRDRYLTENNRSGKLPEGEDLALLPPRVFVYALGLRRFFPVNCYDLKSVPIQENAFDHLQLPAEHKHIIQAAIHSQLRKMHIERELESKFDVQIRTQDFIMGKGKGLIILLHGGPGVGKTATAEAVAQTIRRPLFSVPCNGLFNDVRLAGVLNEIFRLAHRWECVLLLDEADVFLPSRTDDSASSILVSGQSSLYLWFHRAQSQKVHALLTPGRS